MPARVETGQEYFAAGSAAARTPARPKAQASARYPAPSQALHWLVAVLMFSTLPIAWIMQSMAHGAHRDVYVEAHKSIGITIFGLMIVRILWRIGRPVAPLPMPHLMELAAKLSHWALYALLFIIPITGFLTSAATGRSIHFFWLFVIPPLPHAQELGRAAMFAHNLLRLPLYALILGHLLATAFHVAWRRDGLLERMLPKQDGP